MIFHKPQRFLTYLFCFPVILFLLGCGIPPPPPPPPQPMPSNICLSADGYGEKVQAARTDARKELSKIIIVVVETSLVDKYRSKNNELYHDLTSISKEKSRTLLKGVIISPPEKFDHGYRCKAILTRDAYNDSIRYLEGKIFVNLDIRTGKELKEILVYTEYLVALLTTKCSASNGDLLARVKEISDEIYKRLYWGIVNIKTNPKDVNIEIDHKYYQPFTPIYLSPGEYSIRISKNGYQKKTARIYVSKGDKKDYFVTLVPTGIVFYVSLAQANPQLRSKIESLLIRNGLSVSSSSSTANALRFKFSHQEKNIGDFTQYVLELVISASKRKKRICVHSEKIEYFGYSRRLLHKKQDELLKNAINKLFIKIDWNNFK